MSYEIELTNYALKSLKKVPSHSSLRIRDALKKLAENPFMGEKLTGKQAYRVRVGDYRLIYEIHDNILVVLVVNIGHRKDIYKGK